MSPRCADCDPSFSCWDGEHARCQKQPDARWAAYDLTNTRWLYDTCAGGTWGTDVGQALWFDTVEDMNRALMGAEVFEVVVALRVR